MDSCTSVNIITNTPLKKFNINKNLIGKISEKNFSKYIQIVLLVQTFMILKLLLVIFLLWIIFRKIEKDDIFDILNGVYTLKKNGFDLKLAHDCLYHIDDNDNHIKLHLLKYDVCLFK